MSVVGKEFVKTIFFRFGAVNKSVLGMRATPYLFTGQGFSCQGCAPYGLDILEMTVTQTRVHCTATRRSPATQLTSKSPIFVPDGSRSRACRGVGSHLFLSRAASVLGLSKFSRRAALCEMVCELHYRPAVLYARLSDEYPHPPHCTAAGPRC